MKTTVKTENSVIKGAVSLTISAIFVKIIGLIYKIPLSYILSDEGMGYFNSAYTVYTFFYLICTAGIPKAIAIIVGENGNESCERREEIYKSAVFVFLGLGLIVTVLFILFSKYFSIGIGNSSAYFTMISVAPSILFVCLAGVIRGYFNGILKLFPIAVSEIISSIFKLFLGILLVFIGKRLDFSLPVLSALAIFGTTVGAFLGFMYLYLCKKREERKIKVKIKTAFSRKDVVKILKIALPITLGAMVGSIGNIIDLGIIMNKLSQNGYSELQAGILYGNYSTLAIPMLNLLGSLIIPITAILLPIISNGAVKNNKQKLSSSLSGGVEAASYIAAPVTLMYFFKAEEVLKIIFEDTSASMASPLLKFLAPSVFFMCLLTILNTVLEGVGKEGVALLSLVVGSVFKIILTFVFMNNGDYGIIGAPIATAISYAASFLISFFYLTVKSKLRFKLIRPVIESFAFSLIALFISELLFKNIKSQNPFISLIFMLSFAVLYAIEIIIIKFVRKDMLIFGNNAQKEKV